ncbi:MAG: dihydrolipoyl dehydrogenase [Acidimicrobiales bacterium]|nr:dihydrolipoyl dehydrogenase [Acidimicrobiales bacterium]MCB1015971.1 dihydrolipoyl dehydrogenase [Acidimicrobiales bacterium]MCB9373374.1 dihydrolipoyl dehydrogenase [Microthrixaceae bacterium]
MADQPEQFDVVIIGGGPGGYAAALYGAGLGLNIAMVERDKVGGTCLHRGCIPAKELLETASVLRTVEGSAEFGITTSEPTLDFSATQARKQKVVDQLTKGLEGLLKGRKVTTFHGTGTLHADREVRVAGGESGDVTLRGDAVILASGSATRTIPGFDVDGEVVVTSDELLALDRLPDRAAVIGGGAIGCEFASMMSDLGTDVTVLEALPKILPGCDEDVTKVVLRSFKKRGIDVRTGVAVTGHDRGEGGTTVSFGDGESLEVDLVVVSVGRRPLSESLGLEGTAVEVDDRGFVVVDEACRTAEPGVWAIGDLVATPALAHVGFAEGIVAIDAILGEEPIGVDYAAVPWCIYCHPEVAFAGYSESAAKEAGFDVVTSKHRFTGNGRAMIVGETEGLVKVIAEKQGDGTGGRILGVHMVGPWVTEQLGQGYLAVNWEATAAEVGRFIQPHPTMSELFGETIMSLTGRSLHG